MLRANLGVAEALWMLSNHAAHSHQEHAMSDIATDKFKDAVKRAVERWKGKVEGPAKQLVKLDAEITELEGKKPPSEDDKKKLLEAKKSYAALRKQIETANTELRVDLMLLEPPAKTAANEKELMKLPDFIKDIIKAKGVPLGKNVSITPDVKMDFKAMKLKEASVIVTWRF
jgi:predicted  nucleic acid-binding Zn-ribbon protein